MRKVVKCKRSQCGLYFGYTEKDTKCPFCETEYGKTEVRTESDSDTGSEKKTKEKPEEKKLTSNGARTPKKPFKIWG